MTDITLLLKAHAKYFERKLPSGCCVFASHAFALKTNVSSFGRAKREATKKAVQNEVHQFAKSNPQIKDHGDLYRRYLAERHGSVSEGAFFICLEMITRETS